MLSRASTTARAFGSLARTSALPHPLSVTTLSLSPSLRTCVAPSRLLTSASTTTTTTTRSPVSPSSAPSFTSIPPARLYSSLASTSAAASASSLLSSSSSSSSSSFSSSYLTPGLLFGLAAFLAQHVQRQDSAQCDAKASALPLPSSPTSSSPSSSASSPSSSSPSSSSGSPPALPPGLHPVSSAKELDVVLYQYEPCPFCNKVRAFLDFHKIPYRVVEVNPLFKGELSFSAYKKVPVVLVQGVQVNDSSHIIDVLTALLPPPPASSTPSSPSSSPSWLWWWWPFSSSSPSSPSPSPASPSSPALEDSEQVWCAWADNTLVHLLPANIYRTPAEALHSFDYLLEHGKFPAFQRDLARYVGAATMHLLSKYKLNKKYGITAPREQLYQAVQQWLAAVGDKPFHGGSTPSRADIVVFGLLRSIEPYDVFADVMANTSAALWYERMAAAVGPSSRLAA